MEREREREGEREGGERERGRERGREGEKERERERGGEREGGERERGREGERERRERRRGGDLPRIKSKVATKRQGGLIGVPRCRRRRQPNIAHLQPTTETNTEMHLIRTSRNNCNAHWQHDEYRISLAARMPMQSGDSLVVVIIFPLATMLTFTSAVAKLTIRVLGQHHSLLQVISQS